MNKRLRAIQSDQLLELSRDVPALREKAVRFEEEAMRKLSLERDAEREKAETLAKAYFKLMGSLYLKPADPLIGKKMDCFKIE